MSHAWCVVRDKIGLAPWPRRLRCGSAVITGDRQDQSSSLTRGRHFCLGAQLGLRNHDYPTPTFQPRRRERLRAPGGSRSLGTGCLVAHRERPRGNTPRRHSCPRDELWGDVTTRDADVTCPARSYVRRSSGPSSAWRKRETSRPATKRVTRRRDQRVSYALHPAWWFG